MKLYTDKCLQNDAWILKKIQNENINQILKWGVQTRTAFEWLTYIAEEFGELAKAILEHEYRDDLAENVVKEAIQTATLSLKVAEMYNKKEEQ